MEFIPGIMEWTTQGDTVRLPATPMQPIAAAEVVDFLARVTVGEPRGGTVNVAGPEVFTLDELARLILNHRRDGRTVVTDHTAGLFAAVPGRAIVAPKHAHLSSVRYADWMATSPSEPR
ncbi:hypothetical protein [Corynebacterium oculi]|nr:hypothetical protein [Corynebacterium oculi]